MEETTTPKKSMNKMPFIIGGIVLVAAIAAFMMMGSKNTSPIATQEQQQQQSAQPTTVNETPTQAADAMEASESGAMSDDMDTQAFTVEGGSYYFKPNEIRVKKGQEVTITFTNAGGFHDFVIDELNVKSKLLKESGEKDTVTFTPDKAGTYEFYCSVGNHRQMGMKGTLIVE